MSDPVVRVSSLKVTAAGGIPSARALPEETPVALVYDGTTHAVMMATPQDLEDFAYGFSLAEGQVDGPDDIESLDVVEQPNGIELRMWLARGAAHRFATRRRAMLGPTGCGICGVESLEQALPKLEPVARGTRTFSPTEIQAAVSSLAPAQVLNAEARALHAAGFWTLDRGLVALREDVGRHNALDKLAGALARSGTDAAEGVVVLTSRISVEMVQKAAHMRAPVVVAVSAPTALALRTADAAGITLVGIARDDGFEVFTHPSRIDLAAKKAARPSRTRSETLAHAVG